MKAINIRKVFFINVNCCIKVNHWSGQFCCREQLKVTQFRLSEILQQVFVRILLLVKAALLLTHTRRHVPVRNASKTLALFLTAQLLLMFCWLTLCRSTNKRNHRSQLKRNHKKHLRQKHQSHFRRWIETLRWRFDYLSVVLSKKSLG